MKDIRMYHKHNQTGNKEEAEEIEELKEAEEIEKVKETQEVKEIEEQKETEINNKKEIIICCGIQVNCNDKKHKMLEKAEKYISQAKEELAKMGKEMDLLVLPEQFVQLPETAEYYKEPYGIIDKNTETDVTGITSKTGIDIDIKKKHKDKFKDWASRIARKYNTNLVAGSYPCVGKNGKIYNRSLVIDRNGKIIGKYDKIHLFDAFNVRESDIFTAGNELGIFDLDIGKIGVWICYDLRFPEIARALRARDADMFVVPAAFYRPHREHFDILVKSAAIMNVTPIIAVNQCGQLINNSQKGFVGGSVILDAKGTRKSENYLDENDDENMEGYILGEIDKEFTRISREANPEYANRRIDLYKKWL